MSEDVRLLRAAVHLSHASTSVSMAIVQLARPIFECGTGNLPIAHLNDK